MCSYMSFVCCSSGMKEEKKGEEKDFVGIKIKIKQNKQKAKEKLKI